MNKAELKKIVVQTLGFDPEEFKYKLDELETSLSEIKDVLKKTMPAVGQTIVEHNFLKEFLSKNSLNPDKFIEDKFTKMMAGELEEIPGLQIEKVEQ